MEGDPEDGRRDVKLALALCVLAVAQPALAKDKDSAVGRGRDLARGACASCHAVERGRTSPTPRAAPFASREMQHVAGLEGRLSELTARGHYGMPPQALSAKQVSDLLAYIESLASNR
jgi:mono/diheme cytochrome c family protein